MIRTLAIGLVSVGLAAGCVFDQGGVGLDDSLTQSRRKQIDVRVELASGLQDFPVAVVLDVDADLASKANPDGSDLLFTGADGRTVLPFEIESFDSETGSLAAWVTVPEIDAFGGATMFVYYGAANAISQADAADTWGDVFAGVWHLSVEDGAIIDSSQNANHGFAPGASLQPAAAPGVAGAALDFSAVRSHTVTVAEPSNDSLDFGSASYSLSLWVNVEQSVGATDTPWSKGATDTSVPGYNVELGQGDWTANISSLGTLHSASFGDESALLGAWTHLAFVVDRDARTLRTFTNGTESDLVDIGFMGPIENALDATLGGPTALFNGRVDEIRVYGAALSADWIFGEYQNLSDPQSFVRLGVEERL